ncbi:MULTISPECIES: GntR family transcriptional regulator [unclassified Treponema]|uniref:GntR family transcriptional regulator n=1 Tax=unclassified Treponema TaxID=2638727 RepID=UPI0020A40F1B|nr:MULTISPECIES: GntR family transcriptional regulator [unclassified Treponema]
MFIYSIYCIYIRQRYFFKEVKEILKIIISNSSQDPIYEQVYSAIKKAILNGEIEEGAPLPSIRTLAKDLQISVITTKRAYDELERDGFIDSVQGKGSFVAYQNPERLKEAGRSIVEEKIAEAIDEAKRLKITEKEFLQIVKLLFDED